MNRFFVTLTVVIFALMLVTGCSSADNVKDSSPTAVGAIQAPAEYDLSTPESAVRSYLAAISFAYRTGNSEAASATMTAWEGVRVDSYIELNRQQSRGIEQTLTAFEVLESSGEEPTMTVTADEAWAYRYFALADGSYQSEELTAAYRSQYTVVNSGGIWLVDKVQVTPAGEVK
ncbi:MAG: hypothetical protein KJ747_02560 [Actinobacteria bacterium]|nr:hypothetical protein [Actinomycetota bacterium]MCG2807068.1 hypothetical protein [Coriobacteriia bacterium]